jgi:hypothetical protein
MPASDLLLRILATLIGVSVVMLLLSLLVTSLVQFVQSAISLRSRNLQHSLSALIDRVMEGKAQDQPEGEEPSANSPIALARDALKWASFAPPGGGTVMGRLMHFLSPEYSWLELPELRLYLAKRGIKLDASQEDLLEKTFPRMEAYSSKRFLLHVRFITIASALAVAFVFQLDTVQLLHRLSADPAMRERYLEVARGAVGDNKIQERVTARYEDVTEAALKELQERHPDLQPQLEAASGEGGTRDEVMREMALVLEEVPERKNAILKEYAELIDNLHAERAEQALDDIGELTGTLALLDIKPWPRGISFYGRAENWLGIAVTVVLLTLGAPFWFQTLQSLVKLHDVLKPKGLNPKGETPATDETSAAGVEKKAAPRNKRKGGNQP